MRVKQKENKLAMPDKLGLDTFKSYFVAKYTYIKFTVLTMFTCTVLGGKYIHSAVQPSPLSIFITSIVPDRNPDTSNSNSLFPLLPSFWYPLFHIYL